jgi:hypothetical protein
VNNRASLADQIRALEAALEAEIDEEIASASYLGTHDETMAYLIEKIRKRRALLAIKPEFTPEVVGIAKQIIAFGGAGLAFALTFSQNIPELTALSMGVATLYVDLIVVSMIILMRFFLQARTRYPWLHLERLGNSPQYFYYNAVPADYTYKPFFVFRADAKLANALSKYLNNLSSFTDRAIGESKRDELKNELIQYHLLIFYQGYLDQYEQQLTHTALYGFGASFLSSILVVLAATTVLA